MDQLRSALALLPANWAHLGLEVLGAATLLHQSVTRIVPWGVPAATRLADRMVNLILASPLKPLFMWQAPAIIKFIDDLVAALTQVADTFRDRLEEDIKAAEAAQAPVPAAPAPAPAQAPAQAATTPEKP